MAFDEYLGERIQRILIQRNIPFEEKRMMGGLAFMVDGKMCVGVVRDLLMARVGELQYDQALSSKGAKPMDFTGRPMKGYVFVSPDGVDAEEDLDQWIQLCLKFNPFAKASKKKK